jgi:endophilin-A
MSSSRNRSGSTLSASVSRMSLASQSLNTNEPPPRIRRTNTAPANSARYVRAKHEYAGGAHDELPLRVGQIVEIKQVVNDDWYIGESEGESGLFPSSYCEEHIVNPITGAGAPPMPKRSLPPAAGGASRTLAPPVSYRSPSPGLGQYDHSESEFDSQGYDDADHYATAAIVSAPQANPVSRNNTPSPALVGGIKKKAPPPPPSRRSQSSSNILAASTSSSFLTPPQASYRQRSNTATQSVSAEASPFGGSDDEPEQDQEQEYLSSSPSHAGGRGNGLGAMHLGGGGGGGGVDMGDCGVCGCDDFTQNAFKAKGTCSTCFHSHA